MLFGDYQHDVFISYLRGAGPINFHKVREVIARKLGLLARDMGSPSTTLAVWLERIGVAAIPSGFWVSGGAAWP